MTLDSVLMQLPELIDGLPIAPGPGSAVLESTEVEGVAHDSRRVKPGDLFVTWKGLSYDGACFLPQAMERGAVAVLTAEPLAVSPPIPSLIADQPREVLGDLAARVYRHPDRRLRLVGITGTNGKTTVASLLAAMLEADGRPSACLGTLGYRFRQRRIESARTTPEASDLLRLLQESHQEGARDLVMEVSSHALAQGRVAAVRFDVAVFLNLSRDHLDFHADMEEYFAHKSRLFELLKDDGRCVVNVGDDWGRRLAERLPGALTFGETGAVHYGVTAAGTALHVGAHGVSGRIVTPRFEARFESPLLGPYNAENLLAATAAAEALELSRSAVETALCRHPAVEGRMESVRAGQPYPVIVDYAHTDAALRAALRAMRSLGDDRVLVVFGCGGGRDRGKRALMGRAAGELADYSILTSDNPRDEDPHAILKAVEEGLISVGEVAYEVIEDRRQAIRRAIELASSARWAVLIAGKGHETVQIVGSEQHPFVDAVEAAKAIEEHLGTASDC